MKLIFASILSAAAFVGAAEQRALGTADDRFHVDTLTASAVGSIFNLVATHQEGISTNGQAPRVLIFEGNRCPHGRATNWKNAGHDVTAAGHKGYLGTPSNLGIAGDRQDWFEVTTNIATASHTPTGDEGPYKTTLSFRILPSVSEQGSPTWTPTPGTDPADDTGTAKLCVFFGMADVVDADYAAGDIYGFMEIKLTAKFTFDGTFELDYFQTAAYNPKTGDGPTNKTYRTKTTNCSTLDECTVEGNAGTPPHKCLRPGIPACIQVCPKPADVDTAGDVYIKTIDTLDITELEKVVGIVPDDTKIVVGGVTAGAGADVTYGQTNCGDKDGSTPADGAGGTVPAYCCRCIFLLPLQYYPFPDEDNADPLGTDAGSPTRFKVTGESTIGTDTSDTRRLEARELQADEVIVNENAGITEEVEWVLLPEEDLESGSAGLGVAAAGIMGAAALMI